MHGLVVERVVPEHIIVQSVDDIMKEATTAPVTGANEVKLRVRGLSVERAAVIGDRPGDVRGRCNRSALRSAVCTLLIENRKYTTAPSKCASHDPHRVHPTSPSLTLPPPIPTSPDSPPLPFAFALSP